MFASDMNINVLPLKKFHIFVRSVDQHHLHLSWCMSLRQSALIEFIAELASTPTEWTCRRHADRQRCAVAFASVWVGMAHVHFVCLGRGSELNAKIIDATQTKKVLSLLLFCVCWLMWNLRCFGCCVMALNSTMHVPFRHRCCAIELSTDNIHRIAWSSHTSARWWIFCGH